MGDGPSMGNGPSMDKLPTILVPPPLLRAIAAGADPRPLLAQTQPPTGRHYKPPKGYSETQFERDLWQYFPGQIQTGVTVPCPDRAQPYVPDFAYIDPVLNLHIDIEIDEPYTYDTRQPLHYLGAAKDERRNQHFLAAGWVVVRFSEVQAVKTPQSCCKAIASIIASLTGNSSVMTALRPVPTLKPQRRWTQAEAAQMAATHYREQYLTPPAPDPAIAKRKRKRQKSASASAPFATASLTFYCPTCGDGPIPWRGHYIVCPTCGDDGFVL